MLLDDLFLDFGAGTASGFCFGSGFEDQQCIFGGGSSSGLDAIVTTAPVPLPGTLPFLAAALGGLGGLLRALRRRVFSG